jgi:hypothetical protein
MSVRRLVAEGDLWEMGQISDQMPLLRSQPDICDSPGKGSRVMAPLNQLPLPSCRALVCSLQ